MFGRTNKSATSLFFLSLHVAHAFPSSPMPTLSTCSHSQCNHAHVSQQASLTREDSDLVKNVQDTHVASRTVRTGRLADIAHNTIGHRVLLKEERVAIGSGVASSGLSEETLGVFDHALAPFARPRCLPAS
ncbi:hypothetical protein B0H16DRAFT_1702714 [Mycena metata]|uniref:Uncharacterized protein n=1 Tax=Mycena metata TaxID=1033252 RepID=A0AAD7H5V5_9AGAR|nr:hypothetical protein B0H16DRAFT_1702714 [Mycena metata]